MLERSEFARHPLAPSNARNRAAALTSARLFSVLFCGDAKKELACRDETVQASTICKPKRRNRNPIALWPQEGLYSSAKRVHAQGAGGLEVDTAQPMRSCPYWFQIGLLPSVNVV